MVLVTIIWALCFVGCRGCRRAGVMTFLSYSCAGLELSDAGTEEDLLRMEHDMESFLLG